MFGQGRIEENVDYPILIGEVYSASELESKKCGMLRFGSKPLRVTVASLFSQAVSFGRKIVFQKEGL